MKKLIFSTLVAVGLLSSVAGCAQQDKSKRPSPPDSVSQTTANGLVITINYSQPAIKGRTIGKEIAPYGKVWRTGANEATTFEISKDARVEGQPLPAGKYGLYTLPGENEWTVIFNKTWKQWGTVYKMEEDALRVKAKPGKAQTFYEKMTFAIDKTGKVSLMWGDTQVDFNVK
jgi:hypothetical protein